MGWERVELEGGVRFKMTIPKQSDDELRALVRGILDRSLYPSWCVPDSMISMVFMPVMLGALSPSEEVSAAILADLGPEPPKELPSEEPPVPPTLPFFEEAPLLILREVDEELGFKMRWGQMGTEEYAAHVAEVASANEQSRMAHEEVVQLIARSNKKIQRGHDRERSAHRKAMVEYKLRQAEREREWEDQREAREAWHSRYEAALESWLSDLGGLIGTMSETFPRSINGYPMFHAFRVIRKDDWDRIGKAVRRELDRTDNLEV